MKFIRLTVALVTGLAMMQATAGEHREHHEHHDSCNVHSDYAFSTRGEAFLFTRDGSGPKYVAIGGGRLFLDGKEVELPAADHTRLGQFESELHNLLPKVAEVTAEAIDIAFTALIEVSRALSADSQKTINKLEKARVVVMQQIQAKPLAMFGSSNASDDAVSAIIDPIMTDFVPEITGSAVSMALKAVFGGEKNRNALEARMEKLQHEIDTRVDPRAKALEPKALALCESARHLDEIENSFEYRFANGKPLELFSITTHADHSDAP